MVSKTFISVIFVFGVNLVSSSVVNSSGKSEDEKAKDVESSRIPPLVDVIHGKVNSVIHDIVGSIDDVPHLVTEALTPQKEFVVQTLTPVSSKMVDENVTRFESSVEDNIILGVVNKTWVTPLPDDISVLNETVFANESETVEKHETEPVKVPLKVAIPSAPSPPEAKPHDALPEEKNATHDDIPSFSEWAKKQMAEVGKNKGENLTVGTMKLRGKNYASPDCGAKVVAANPEAVSPGAILSPSRDDYMLNPCNVKIWFVVELCESIQPQRVEIANFELFSSSPQDLTISMSDRYPTRDWSQVSTVQAKDERTVQTFSLPYLSNFAKYMKVELHSHYGTEHYCPISLFKAFGASELEVLDHADAQDDEPAKSILEEDESDEDLREGNRGDFLAPVKAAVMHVVQKAAEVLVVKGGKMNNTCTNVTLSKSCLEKNVVCTNCSEQFYSQLLNVMCCQESKLNTLLTNSFIHSVMLKSSICSQYGFSFFEESMPNCSSANYSNGISFMKAFFNNETIAGLCNFVGVKNTTESVITENNEVQSTSSVPELPESEITSSLIHPTKTLPEENATTPELPTNHTLDSDVPLLNETKSEETNSSLEATPPLETQYLIIKEEEEEEKNQTILNSNSSIADMIVQPSSQDEPVVVDSLALDSLFPEEEEQTQDPEASSTKATMNPKVQKESIFVRLANRIKALEVNMSLSSQYLEELSRRYKKQVEELQRSLSNMMEEIKLSSEREKSLTTELTKVTSKVEILTATVEQLLEENNGWGHKVYFFGHHGVIIALEIIMLFFCIGVCKWLTSSNGRSLDNVRNKKLILPQRRHSLDVVVADPPLKKRRPSEEACIPSGSSHQDLLLEPVKRKISKDHSRKRKRKKKEKDEGDILTIGSGGEEASAECTNCCSSTKEQRPAQTQTSSSQETLSSIQPPSVSNSIKKKTGAFKKIVKKLF